VRVGALPGDGLLFGKGFLFLPVAATSLLLWGGSLLFLLLPVAATSLLFGSMQFSQKTASRLSLGRHSRPLFLLQHDC